MNTIDEKVIKEALCSFVEEIQTENFNNHDINEGIIRDIYLFHT